MAERIGPFDTSFFKQLLKEGMSPAEAGYVAGAEMDGAPEARGDVNARQTACHFLREPPCPLPSRGAEEGRIATTTALNKWLEDQGLPPGDRGVEEWIKQQEKKQYNKNKK